MKQIYENGILLDFLRILESQPEYISEIDLARLED